MFDLKLPFFRPMWRRIATVLVCFGWGTVEFVSNAPFFGIVFVGMGVVAGYQFFFNWTDPGEGS